MSDKKICAAPWSHLMIQASGEIATCWSSQPYNPEHRSLGQLQTDDLEQIWNHQNIKEVRKAFINGQTPLQCQQCFKLECQNIISDRQSNFIFDYIDIEKKIQKTAPDGSLDVSELNSLELILSNVCNFTCRTCNVGSSSAWAKEHQILFNTKIDEPVRRPFPDYHETASRVHKLAPNVKRLSFIGGEPLIQPEHFQLLNLLIDSKQTDVKLCYTTNLSDLVFRNKSILDLWKQFDEIYLTFSLDGIKDKGEYIRKGFNWDEFQNNLKKISEELNNVMLSCNVTVSVLNILDLVEIFDFIESQGVDARRVKLLPVKNPRAYSVTILPTEVKASIRKLYEAERFHGWIHDQMRGLLDYMDSRDDSVLLPQFFALNVRLDLLRGENTLPIQPIVDAISKNMKV